MREEGEGGRERREEGEAGEGGGGASSAEAQRAGMGRARLAWGTTRSVPPQHLWSSRVCLMHRDWASRLGHMGHKHTGRNQGVDPGGSSKACFAWVPGESGRVVSGRTHSLDHRSHVLEFPGRKRRGVALPSGNLMLEQRRQRPRKGQGMTRSVCGVTSGQSGDRGPGGCL